MFESDCSTDDNYSIERISGIYKSWKDVPLIIWSEHFRKPKNERNSLLSSFYEKEFILMKRMYCFLEESQIVGKTLTKFGIPNICGKIRKSFLQIGVKSKQKLNRYEKSHENYLKKQFPASVKNNFKKPLSKKINVRKLKSRYPPVAERWSDIALKRYKNTNELTSTQDYTFKSEENTISTFRREKKNDSSFETPLKNETNLQLIQNTHEYACTLDDKQMDMTKTYKINNYGNREKQNLGNNEPAIPSDTLNIKGSKKLLLKTNSKKMVRFNDHDLCSFAPPQIYDDSLPLEEIQHDKIIKNAQSSPELTTISCFNKGFDQKDAKYIKQNENCNHFHTIIDEVEFLDKHKTRNKQRFEIEPYEEIAIEELSNSFDNHLNKIDPAEKLQLNLECNLNVCKDINKTNSESEQQKQLETNMLETSFLSTRLLDIAILNKKSNTFVVNIKELLAKKINSNVSNKSNIIIEETPSAQSDNSDENKSSHKSDIILVKSSNGRCTGQQIPENRIPTQYLHSIDPTANEDFSDEEFLPMSLTENDCINKELSDIKNLSSTKEVNTHFESKTIQSNKNEDELSSLSGRDYVSDSSDYENYEEITNLKDDIDEFKEIQDETKVIKCNNLLLISPSYKTGLKEYKANEQTVDMNFNNTNALIVANKDVSISRIDTKSTKQDENNSPLIKNTKTCKNHNPDINFSNVLLENEKLFPTNNCKSENAILKTNQNSSTDINILNKKANINGQDISTFEENLGSVECIDKSTHINLFKEVPSSDNEISPSPGTSFEKGKIDNIQSREQNKNITKKNKSLSNQLAKDIDGNLSKEAYIIDDEIPSSQNNSYGMYKAECSQVSFQDINIIKKCQTTVNEQDISSINKTFVADNKLMPGRNNSYDLGVNNDKKTCEMGTYIIKTSQALIVEKTPNESKHDNTIGTDFNITNAPVKVLKKAPVTILESKSISQDTNTSETNENTLKIRKTLFPDNNLVFEPLPEKSNMIEKTNTKENTNWQEIDAFEGALASSDYATESNKIILTTESPILVSKISPSEKNSFQIVVANDIQSSEQYTSINTKSKRLVNHHIPPIQNNVDELSEAKNNKMDNHINAIKTSQTVVGQLFETTDVISIKGIFITGNELMSRKTKSYKGTFNNCQPCEQDTNKIKTSQTLTSQQAKSQGVLLINEASFSDCVKTPSQNNSNEIGEFDNFYIDKENYIPANDIPSNENKSCGLVSAGTSQNRKQSTNSLETRLAKSTDIILNKEMSTSEEHLSCQINSYEVESLDNNSMSKNSVKVDQNILSKEYEKTIEESQDMMRQYKIALSQKVPIPDDNIPHHYQINYYEKNLNSSSKINHSSVNVENHLMAGTISNNTTNSPIETCLSNESDSYFSYEEEEIVSKKIKTNLNHPKNNSLVTVMTSDELKEPKKLDQTLDNALVITDKIQYQNEQKCIKELESGKGFENENNAESKVRTPRECIKYQNKIESNSVNNYKVSLMQSKVDRPIPIGRILNKLASSGVIYTNYELQEKENNASPEQKIPFACSSPIKITSAKQEVNGNHFILNRQFKTNPTIEKTIQNSSERSTENSSNKFVSKYSVSRSPIITQRRKPSFSVNNEKKIFSEKNKENEYPTLKNKVTTFAHTSNIQILKPSLIQRGFKENDDDNTMNCKTTNLHTYKEKSQVSTDVFLKSHKNKSSDINAMILQQNKINKDYERFNKSNIENTFENEGVFSYSSLRESSSSFYSPADLSQVSTAGHLPPTSLSTSNSSSSEDEVESLKSKQKRKFDNSDQTNFEMSMPKKIMKNEYLIDHNPKKNYNKSSSSFAIDETILTENLNEEPCYEGNKHSIVSSGPSECSNTFGTDSPFSPLNDSFLETTYLNKEENDDSFVNIFDEAENSFSRSISSVGSSISEDF